MKNSERIQQLESDRRIAMAELVAQGRSVLLSKKITSIDDQIRRLKAKGGHQYAR